MSFVFTCSVCGSDFESNRFNAKYCSDQCRQKAGCKYKAMPKFEKNCIVCGRTFAGRKNRLICSEECQKEHQRQQSRIYSAKKKNEIDLLVIENQKFWEQAAAHRKFRHTDPEALSRHSISAAAIGVSYGDYVGHKDTMTEESFRTWCIQRVIEKQNRERAENERK